MITNQKLGQSDLVYWVYRSSCADSWTTLSSGCLFFYSPKCRCSANNFVFVFLLCMRLWTYTQTTHRKS